jgi:cell division protein FtsQ
MGSSRASTPAGRRRTAARRGAGGTKAHAGAKRAAKKPATRTAPKKTTKKAPKRSAPKARKPAPKRTKKAPKLPAAPLAARLPRMLAIGTCVLVALVAGYFLWFRNSSLVAVEKVTVSGASGPEAEEARGALTKAAGEMTTLNVDEAALRAAVAGLPTVLDVSADAAFPHDLEITVVERPPVLVARSGEQEVPVAGDGTVLTGVELGQAKLPAIGVEDLPAKGKLTGDALAVALVAGAAPAPLRELIEEVAIGPPEGVQVTLRGDIPLYFGGSERADEKWAAAAAVLADPKIKALTYVDVRVPARPAIGGAAPAVSDDTTDATEPETAVTAPETP